MLDSDPLPQESSLFCPIKEYHSHTGVRPKDIHSTFLEAHSGKILQCYCKNTGFTPFTYSNATISVGKYGNLRKFEPLLFQIMGGSLQQDTQIP